MEEEIEEFAKTSKINSAMLVNSTLNELWKEFYTHFRAGKYLSSNVDLDCIWTILGGEDKIEKSKIEDNYKEIETKLKNSGILQDSLGSIGFNRVRTEDIQKFAIQKGILLSKALFLRRLQNSQGKGTAYEDKDEEESE